MHASAKSSPETLGYGRQYVDRDDVDAVARTMLGDHLTQGPEVPRFEAGLCQVTGAPQAVAVSSGTAALHLAYFALGVGPGHNVLTSANTFLATATAAHMCGGEAEFVDIDARTGNMDMALLERRLGAGRGPHVVTVVHFAGLPCDMEWVLSLKRRHDFLLVEDASHALGARYRVEGRWYHVGEHPEVDATVLSFHPVKHITTGEGGAILTHDARLAARLRRLRSHGVDPEADHLPFPDAPVESRVRKPAWFAPMVELGFNYRLTDLQAALGSSQLTRLPEFLEARREIALRYLAELRDYELPVPAGFDDQSDREHAWHLFVIRCGSDERDELQVHLAQEGIGTQVHYYPVPLQPWFRGRPGARTSYPRAEVHAKCSLSIPIYPALSEEQQARVIAALMDWRLKRAVA